MTAPTLIQRFNSGELTLDQVIEAGWTADRPYGNAGPPKTTPKETASSAEPTTAYEADVQALARQFARPGVSARQTRIEAKKYLASETGDLPRYDRNDLDTLPTADLQALIKGLGSPEALHQFIEANSSALPAPVLTPLEQLTTDPDAYYADLANQSGPMYEAFLDSKLSPEEQSAKWAKERDERDIAKVAAVRRTAVLDAMVKSGHDVSKVDELVKPVSEFAEDVRRGRVSKPTPGEQFEAELKAMDIDENTRY